MKRIACLFLCSLLACTVLCTPAAAARSADIVPAYTPSTAEEACAIPLNVEQGYRDDSTGTLNDTTWTTLYNPYTAQMMVDLSIASYEIADDDAAWRTVMREYGYEQLQHTHKNEIYAAKRYHYTNKQVDENLVEVTFPSINAIVGIQDVTYNGRTRHAVAVTFRGTADADDWLTDLLMGVAPDFKDGFHLGFSENAEDFYRDLSKEITFWVDGRDYTLFEIYDEMRVPDSDFCMLVMGHSLGGALADVLVGLYLYNHDVHPSNVAAYTIAAAPSARNGYPYPYKNIYNIINEDDLVPSATIKFGEHIGVNLSFHPDAAFREKHYGMFNAPEISPGDVLWQLAISAATGFKTHNAKTTYRPIVELISAEIAASTAENPSIYTKYSTSGHNDWGLGDAVINPYTFGDFPKDVRVGSALVFEEGGVMQVAGDLYTGNSLHMHHKDDYLLVEGDTEFSWGVHQDRPLHLTAGTVELKGDLSTGKHSFWSVPYHATGSHRTVLSGTKTQNIHFYGEQIAAENLYIRNPKVNITGLSYARLAEDAEITASPDLYIHQLDLNGFTLEQEGAMGIHTLTMEGGGLQVSDDLEIHTLTVLDGGISVGSNFETPSTLPFGSGQMRVEGNCYLPATLIMRNEEDCLYVGGDLTVYARDWDEIPDDHLSAGEVEIKGDLRIDDMGVCTANAWHETGTHKTILSGDGPQILWWINKVGPANRFENLCIRNPLTSLVGVRDVRLGEDAQVAVLGDNTLPFWQIDGSLDLGGHALTIDFSDLTEDIHQLASVNALDLSDGGTLEVDGSMKLFTGTLNGDLTVHGDLTLDSRAEGRLDFVGGTLYVGGDCTLPCSLTMDSDDDYLFVGGTLTVASNNGALPEDHLSAGTVELHGGLNVLDSRGKVTYCATGTHRTIFSGTGEQAVSMGAMTADKRLQACLRNPDTVFNSVHTLVLMEGGALNQPERCYIHGTLDLNGYPLRMSGTMGKVTAVIGGTPIGVTVAENKIGQPEITVTCPELPKSETAETPAAIHVLFTGFDEQFRMVVCETMTFTSESDATQTLTLANWPQCSMISAFWLEGNLAPFCTAMDLGL